MDFTACLDPSCHAPAELVDVYEAESTAGLVVIYATHCAAGHRYCGPRNTPR